MSKLAHIDNNNNNNNIGTFANIDHGNNNNNESGAGLQNKNNGSQIPFNNNDNSNANANNYDSWTGPNIPLPPSLRRNRSATSFMGMPIDMNIYRNQPMKAVNTNLILENIYLFQLGKLF